MEEFGSLWNYQEGMDELRQKLLYMTIELESVKMEANEEIRKKEENLKQLLLLIKTAYQERDEAKDQLQKLVTKLFPTNPIDPPTNFLSIQTENPIMIPGKANSSITESSNSLSGSSPVDSFFDTVTSPDFSTVNFTNQPFIQDYNAIIPTSKFDKASAVIDNYIEGKPLPEKGKLLQAVMEAGPLLQTLLVAGPLPRWRNPPPFQQFKIPPVSISNQKSLNSSNFIEMNRGFPQMCSSSLLNFQNASAGLNNHISSVKKQRFQ